MKTKTMLSICLGALTAGCALAAEGPVPENIPHLDHVFLVMMENHGYGQVVGNPNCPFINDLASFANSTTTYFAIGHPSLTNYLEVVGGSNFGERSDNAPDWHDGACTPDIVAVTTNTDNPPSPNICPIAGSGMDAETPAVDTTNETSGPPGLNDIDGIQSVPAAPTTGKTIADQLASQGRSWKSYQEDLPVDGADLVNYADGQYSNLTDFSTITPTLSPALASGDIVQLYASKHNPFVYFRSIQEGDQPGSDLTNVVGFDGPGGLYADLGSGNVPTFSFIVPNQCNDQHGRGNSTAFCAYDPTDNGTQAGLNPALMNAGDVAVKRIVNAIKASPVWPQGNNAIVVVWDENDYSSAPNINTVLVIVDTNYGSHGLQSTTTYNHFSLLRSLEAGFSLPCLNHACDSTTVAMSDLFGYSYNPVSSSANLHGAAPARQSKVR